MNTLDLSTLTVSPCVTRFHYLSHSLMAFLTVLQILSGFFSQTHNFLRKQTRQQNIVALPSTYKKKTNKKNLEFLIQRLPLGALLEMMSRELPKFLSKTFVKHQSNKKCSFQG